MKIAYFDCFSGISGDMALGALLDAGLPLATLRRELKKLPLDGYTITQSLVMRAGIACIKARVRVAPSKNHHHHSHYRDIHRLIVKSGLSAPVKRLAIAIFEELAAAEAQVHEVPKEQVHFHEVGAVDSIVDIVGAAVGLAHLGIEKVYASPVNTGSGTVESEHGVLPVPAPATALLLRGAPTYASGPPLELTTPTGAAILAALSKGYGPQPLMTVRVIGHGAGGHDFPHRANVLRLFIGEAADTSPVETLIELSTNIDDMNPQALALVAEMLFDAGALDVALCPIQMKKGRPGVTMTALCAPQTAPALETILFENTSTLGVRRNEVERVSLPREIRKVKTRYGAIEVKFATLPGGRVKAAPEFESVKKAALKSGASFEMVYRAALSASHK